MRGAEMLKSRQPMRKAAPAPKQQSPYPSGKGWGKPKSKRSTNIFTGDGPYGSANGSCTPVEKTSTYSTTWKKILRRNTIWPPRCLKWSPAAVNILRLRRGSGRRPGPSTLKMYLPAFYFTLRRSFIAVLGKLGPASQSQYQNDDVVDEIA